MGARKPNPPACTLACVAPTWQSLAPSLCPPRPAGFLSVLSGSFDPSLMCVMGGALLVALPAFQLALRSARPLCAACFELPTKRHRPFPSGRRGPVWRWLG